MSGGAGVLFSVLAAAFLEALPAWVFWAISMACLFVAFFSVWRKTYHALQRVEALLAANRAPAATALKHEVDALTEAQREALRIILDYGQLTESQLHQRLAQKGFDQVDCAVLQHAGFLTRDFVGYWTANESRRSELKALLKA